MDLGIRYGSDPRWFHRLPQHYQVDVLAWAAARGEIDIGGRPNADPQPEPIRSFGRNFRGTDAGRKFWAEVIK